jgi:hypothetical protein
MRTGYEIREGAAILTARNLTLTGFADHAENFHPFECNGAGKCVHCDRRRTADHDPATCALCDPEYDFVPTTAIDDQIDRSFDAYRRGGKS